MLNQIKLALRHALGKKLAKKLGFWYKTLFGVKADATELQYIEQMTKYMHPATTVFDIGANVGVWTKILSRAVGANGKVLAFEPIESTFQILKQQCGQLNNVHLFQKALSNENGVKQIYIDPTSAAPPGASINETAKHINDLRVQKLVMIPIEVARLDDLSLPIQGCVSFMKIDVEGHEAPVITGASQLIQYHRPVIFMEILREQWMENNPEKAEVVVILKKLGYSFGQVLPNRVVFDTLQFDLRYENFLFVPIETK
jgi:FkbM family methyltransferase